MNPYFFSLHMIIAASIPPDAPIEQWLAARTLVGNLANEENQ